MLFRHIGGVNDQVSPDSVTKAKNAFFAMLDEASQALLGDRLLSLDEAFGYYQKLYLDTEVNSGGLPVPQRSDIFTLDGGVYLNENLRMNSINLLNNFVTVYFNNSHAVKSHPEQVKIVLAILMLSASSAFDAIDKKVKQGLLHPNAERPNLITLAGTGNPLHFAHILTALEALAYMDSVDVVEFLTHAIDPRKDDLLHIFHRFLMVKDILDPFAPFIRTHGLDAGIHAEIALLAGAGVEVVSVPSDTGYTTEAFINREGRRVAVLPDSRLRYLTADGESKFYLIMAAALSGVRQLLFYIAGSDHRNYIDTHKKTGGLMLDTVGKLALVTKRYSLRPDLQFNASDHRVVYLCNVRDPKEIDNEVLLRQFGLTFLGLEHVLLVPKKLRPVFDSVENGKTVPVEGSALERNYKFFGDNMESDFTLKIQYLHDTIEALDIDGILSRPIVKNVDDPTDETEFTLADALAVSRVDLSVVAALVQKQKAQLLLKLNADDRVGFDALLSRMAVDLMVTILGIRDIGNDSEVVNAIEGFLGIGLRINHASTAFSSTQVREYFTGKATENWAALLLPLPTLAFIDNRLSYSGDVFGDESRSIYGVDQTLVDASTGILGLLSGLRTRVVPGS